MANKIEKRLKRELEINIVDIFDSPINRKFYFVRQISFLSAHPPSPLPKNHFPNDFAQTNRKKKKNHISLLPNFRNNRFSRIDFL